MRPVSIGIDKLAPGDIVYVGETLFFIQRIVGGDSRLWNGISAIDIKTGVSCELPEGPIHIVWRHSQEEMAILFEFKITVVTIGAIASKMLYYAFNQKEEEQFDGHSSRGSMVFPSKSIVIVDLEGMKCYYVDSVEQMFFDLAIVKKQ